VKRRRRGLLLAALYVALVSGGWLLGRWLTLTAELDIRPSNEPEMHALIMGSTVVYVLASALPFIPGAEIGFALIMMLGVQIIPLVYISMLLALTLSYLVGRLIPARMVAGIFGFCGLSDARDLVLRIAPLSAHARVDLLIAHAPRRILPFLLRHRYLALFVALNLPGNTLIGGGGGIALAAGMSGIFPIGPYFMTIAIAVAPVPLFILGLRLLG